MLVIVEHGDVELVDEGFLDGEAFRSLDVLEVDTSERRRDELAEVDHLLRVLRIDFDIEHVDVSEPLEQDSLALHDGLARSGTDIAQTQHSRTVRDDGHQVTLGRVAVRELTVAGDLQAGLSHARRIR